MIRYQILVLCVIINLFANNVNSARILGVFPVPSISHQVVFQAYAKELAKNGHELVIITPNPLKEKNANITEIDVSASYQEVKKIMNNDPHKMFRRGVVQDPSPEILTELYSFVTHMFIDQFNQPAVKNLINNKEHFDLVVIEAFLEYPLIFSHLFKAPTILLCSFYGFSKVYDTVGAATRHPIFYPHIQRTKYRDYTFWDRVRETVTEFRLMYSESLVEQYQNKALKDNYGPDAPTVHDLQNNIDLLFLNSHPIITNNRPVPSNVVHLGGLHLQPVKELPQDLKQYLDRCHLGVVYVSFGSNVRPANMDEDLLNTFLTAFNKLPYNILWKFDGDNLKNVPKNVKIQKWFPQRDLLGHPNIKAFVTQGGLQSFDEAVDVAVPLIGIPMMNDQWHNVNKFVELGIGLELDALTMNADDIVIAVETVIKNDSFKKNMERVRTIWYDQPQKPIERALWWTEYVLRHGGGRHLRAATANVTWREYWMIDVLAFLLVIFILAVFILVITVRKVLKLFVGKSKVKVN
ncbi:UDP-glucosyltransferase 2 [Amyelois transitella]|uniref:UDP-glucosyltransferase 2 n=1 Tax=Amyelois transitella TaxID=680683 RepID=UPI00067E10AB|nr:UDP-glucosyltransferase 2 [Amyelois transitella]